MLSIPIIALTVRENEALAKEDTAVGLGKAKPKKEIGKKDVEGVFVVGTDNKVTFRPVKVGIAGEKHFEVLSGLKKGDNIVAGTYQAIRELKDGALIREAKVDAEEATGQNVSQNIVHDSLEAPLGATAERQAVVGAAGATPGTTG